MKARRFLSLAGYISLATCALRAESIPDATAEIKAADTPSLQTELAAMNQKWLKDFQNRNLECLLYSFVPLDPTEDYYRDFKVIFFRSDSRRLTKLIRYVKIDKVWQPSGLVLHDPEKVKQSNQTNAAEQGAAANPYPSIHTPSELSA